MRHAALSLRSLDGAGERGVFEKQRHIIALEIRTNAENARTFEEAIQDFNKTMTISAVCQEIGMQALFAAATMGLASYLTVTGRMAAAGEWLAGLGAEGSMTARAVNVAASVGGLSRGATGAEALSGILARGFAGVVILTVRRVTGDLGTQKAMNFDGIAGALAVTLLVALAGSPGAPRANLTPLRNLVERLPSAVSWQGVVQAEMATLAGVKAWLQQPENRSFADYLAQHRDEFERGLDAVATKSAQALLDWALAAQNQLASNVEAEARKKDYSQYMPFFARHFDFVGNADALRDMVASASVYQAETDFWIAVSHALNDLEQATKSAKQIGK
jgi:hypothetical protein